jgi:hypothetical protein
VSPADSFATAIGVGIGINVGIELTNPISAKFLADRLATLSELREHDHTTNEQCLLLAVVVCAQRIAHQGAATDLLRCPFVWLEANTLWCALPSFGGINQTTGEKRVGSITLILELRNYGDYGNSPNRNSRF